MVETREDMEGRIREYVASIVQNTNTVLEKGGDAQVKQVMEGLKKAEEDLTDLTDYIEEVGPE